MPRAKCDKHRGGGKVCGGPLRFRTDGIGRVVADCDWCARIARGQCRHCQHPVLLRWGRKFVLCAEHERYRVMMRARARAGVVTPMSRSEAARVGGLKGGPARARKLGRKRVREIALKANAAAVIAKRAQEAERQRKRLAYLGRAA